MDKLYDSLKLLNECKNNIFIKYDDFYDRLLINEVLSSCDIKNRIIVDYNNDWLDYYLDYEYIDNEIKFANTLDRIFNVIIKNRYIRLQKQGCKDYIEYNNKIKYDEMKRIILVIKNPFRIDNDIDGKNNQRIIDLIVLGKIYGIAILFYFEEDFYFIDVKDVDTLILGKNYGEKVDKRYKLNHTDKSCDYLLINNHDIKKIKIYNKK